MSRYVRINTLPGFSDVRYFYWFDSVEKQVLSFPNKIRSFDPNVNTIYGSSGVIGSRQCGDVRYNFATNGRFNQSAQLRKVVQAYAQLKGTACQAVKQEVAPATVAKAKFAIIRMSTNTVVARDLDEAAARKNIENRVKSNGGEYMLVQQVAIAKATNCVAWG